ncbi:hypothetical protein HDV00_007159 [Rhizophlyctis rosea]|nr:hypothetical protein HDV00_007159 [Rhizophlyctis rosea]
MYKKHGSVLSLPGVGAGQDDGSLAEKSASAAKPEKQELGQSQRKSKERTRTTENQEAIKMRKLFQKESNSDGLMSHWVTFQEAIIMLEIDMQTTNKILPGEDFRSNHWN